MPKQPNALRTHSRRLRQSALVVTAAAFGSGALLLSARPAPGSPAKSARSQTAAPLARVRTTWDSTFLYVAFEIDATDVEASRRETMATGIELDDSVGVYLKVDDSAETHAMLVSAAGGFTFLKGAADGSPYSPRPLFSIKYATTVNGTLNRSDDRDKGYTIEMAIPWNAIGVDPAKIDAKSQVRASFTVRRRGGGIASFPTGADPEKSSTWGQLALVSGATGIPTPKASRAPLIDGTVVSAEWIGDASRFDAPSEPVAAVSLSPVALIPVAPEDAAPVSVSVAQIARAATPAVFARFLLSYQADLFRPLSPPRGVFNTGGIFLTIDQPAFGFGPWYSVERVNWHRTELSQMRRGGIDVALVEVGGVESGVDFSDDKSLTVLAAAFAEARADRQSLPQVTLCVDTKRLGAPTDLSTDEGRARLYAILRNWFLRIPASARYSMIAGDGPSARRVYPVFLSGVGELTGLDSPGWAQKLTDRLASEFDGANIAFAGLGGLPPSPALIASLPALSGPGVGAVSSYLVQPGSLAPLVSRKSTETFKASWDAARLSAATWIVVDSWNDFARATEIAPSRQYGERFVDLNRIGTFGLFLGRDASARIVTADIPRVMASGQLAAAQILLRNTGGKVLDGATTSVGYRWLQNGAVVAGGTSRFAVSRTLAPGDFEPLKVGLSATKSAADGKSEPLAPGNYVLKLDLNSPSGDSTVELPVRVVSSGDAVEFGESSFSPMMRTGTIATGSVQLRWLGPIVKPGELQLVYQLLSQDGARVINSVARPIDVPLLTGRFVTIPVRVGLIDSAGLPIEPAYPEQRAATPDGNRHGYRLRWFVTRPNSPTPASGGADMGISVYPGDADARVASPKTYREQLKADEGITFDLTVTNRGAARWSRGEFAVGVRWFQADGFPVSITSLPASSPIDREVAPGETVTVPVYVRAPDRIGRYTLGTWVQKSPDASLAAHPIAQSGDIAFLSFSVTGGKIVALDLTKQFDTDAVSSGAAPGDGAWGGPGLLPAEWFPDDRFGMHAGARSFPAGYFAEVASLPSRGVTFVYGSSADGAKNALSCLGQTLALSKASYLAAHLALGSVSDKDEEIAFTIVFADKTTQTIKRTIRPVTTPVGADEAVAFRVPLLRGKDAESDKSAAIRHLLVPLPVGKPVVGIVLPQNAKVYVFAVSMER